jgi:hypothetical protein
MHTFRCYALDKQGAITAAENIEADDLDAAIEAGWRFVAAHHAGLSTPSFGLEVWHGKTLLFTTRQGPTAAVSGLVGPVRQPPVPADTNPDAETRTEKVRTACKALRPACLAPV